VLISAVQTQLYHCGHAQAKVLLLDLANICRDFTIFENESLMSTNVISQLTRCTFEDLRIRSFYHSHQQLAIIVL